MKLIIVLLLLFINEVFSQPFSPAPKRDLTKKIIKNAFAIKHPNYQFKKIKYSWKNYGTTLSVNAMISSIKIFHELYDIYNFWETLILEQRFKLADLMYYEAAIIEFQVFQKSNNSLKGFVHCRMFNMEYPNIPKSELSLSHCWDHEENRVRRLEFESTSIYEKLTFEKIKFSKLEFNKYTFLD
ncbi:hypothetical protein N9N67_01260 [Bacteriovoracaceae bacterium]|nr:hypothetical protein [Bacteriovoracaceae bacterium]